MNLLQRIEFWGDRHHPKWQMFSALPSVYSFASEELSFFKI
jgi:hypothetical protein